MAIHGHVFTRFSWVDQLSAGTAQSFTDVGVSDSVADGVSEHIATGQNEAQWGKLTGSERERERDGVTINRPIKQSVPASFCPQIASSAFRSETSILWAMGNVDWQYLVSRN